MENIFLAEVRNIKDPHRQGRVQIRVYGVHDNEQTVKDADLPWALPLLPTTSASTGKVGVIPTGMLVGSRVLGVFLDPDTKKYPFIIGTYPRAYKPSDQNDNTGGVEGNDKSSVGVDIPSSGNPKPPGAADNLGKTPTNPAVGGKPLDTEKDKYNKAQYKDNGEGPDGIDEARKKFAPKADEPTIAGAPLGLDLPSAIKMIDPLGTAQSLAQMFIALSIVKSIMNLTSKSGNSSGVKTTVIDALSGALCILSNKYGYTTVIDVFTECLANGAINQIDPQYRNIVTEALGSLIKKASQHGVDNLPISNKPDIIYHTETDPVPLPIKGAPPDLYIQQYYDSASDPWKGFIQWKGPNGDYVYTVRGPSDYPFSSAQNHVYSLAEEHLANALDIYIKNKKLTAAVLNGLLQQSLIVTQNNGIEKTLGKNSSLNPALLLGILGSVGVAINLAQSLLPDTALNTGSVSKSLMTFTTNIAILKTMKMASIPAFGLPGIGSSALLGSLAGISLGNFAGNLVGDAVGDVLGDVLGEQLGDIAGDVAGAVTTGAISLAAVNNLGGSLNKTAVLTNILIRSL
jgi:hypothetical protein